MLPQTDRRFITKSQQDLQTLKLQLDVMTKENGKGEIYAKSKALIDRLILKLESETSKIKFHNN